MQCLLNFETDKRMHNFTCHKEPCMLVLIGIDSIFFMSFSDMHNGDQIQNPKREGKKNVETHAAIHCRSLCSKTMIYMNGLILYLFFSLSFSKFKYQRKSIKRRWKLGNWFVAQCLCRHARWVHI